MGRIYDAGLSFVYDFQYSKLLQRAKDNGYIQSVTREELRAYKARWAPLGRSVNAVYYKLFSAYVGKDLNLIPEDIAHSVVEALLNPPAQRGPFSDKNLFDRIVGPKMMPRTFCDVWMAYSMMLIIICGAVMIRCFMPYFRHNRVLS